ILWFQMLARMYNGSGSLGRLDVLLTPYYERDVAAGTLTDEEAIFHLACLLVRDTGYIQLGGPDAAGQDVTNRVSYLVLEACHRLRVPANVGVAVGPHVDGGLLRRGVEILCQDRLGIPKFLAVENTAAGFAKNGYPPELGRERAYSGCHWSAIPGREYAINDCVKINFGAVFEVALRDMLARNEPPSLALLWETYARHLRRAVEVTAESIDFHLAHMHEVFPELVLDLLCYGPLEKGLDASHGGVEFYNLCIDGCALATVADSFAALAQRVEEEGRLSWAELLAHLDADWAGAEGERARLMMRSIRRFGYGGTLADEYAVRLARLFTDLVKEKPTPAGFNLIPGIFSWANTISMGRTLGATPNGRRRGEPISHGANPDPGFRPDGAPTAMAVAIAAVQPGYGNTAPLQLEVDPTVALDRYGEEYIADLIRTHFDLGGTQINLNVMDAAQVLAAHRDPSLFPDLIVRVTGFSAYFGSLSPEFRQLVVDRIVAAG
ncbi:MAG: formate acetyltransferase, partial [Chloroflexi bacterium]|nr:formate acetyltransferase [Chloroflexota bacterium]